MSRGVQRRGEQGGFLVNLVVLLSFAALCVLLYLVRHPLMRYAAESWIVDEPAPHADAILVLGDDNFYADRATRATELYRQGVAPIVVASGRRLRPNAGMSELMDHDLVQRGVPKEKVVRFAHDADSTREEAAALARLVQERNWKSVVVVTSNYHSRRARYIFRQMFPAGIAVSVASARDGDFDPQRWWEKRKSSKLFAREIAGMLLALWELHGDGKGSAPQGAESRLGVLGPRRACSLGSPWLWKNLRLPFAPGKCCNMFTFLGRNA
jgi:uncharacterized SAM-binding protein YcdF (DUF218 family)